jgi:uncharacterized protein (TIGR03435 family)
MWEYLKVTFMLGVACTAVAYGQGLAEPQFEVASVKVAGPSEWHRATWQQDFGGRTGRVFYKDVTLQELIGHAYRVRAFQIAGPDWITVNRYDLEAIPPVGTAREQYPELLQRLLAERFGLTLRKVQRDQTVYILKLGSKTPALRRTPATARRSMVMSINAGQITLTAAAATMGDLADYLMDNVRSLECPVLNRTGLEGAFDFILEWVPDKPITMNGNVAGDESAAGLSVFTAVRQQLGLKLEPEKTRVDSLLVVGAEKTPSAN